MAAPRGAFSRPFIHTPPPRSSGDGHILAVGWRVLVASPAGRGNRVTLTDSDGSTAVSSVPDGAEVEILAWRPRRSGSTLYHVQPTGGGAAGWLTGASLKPRAVLPAAKVQSIAVARPQPPAKAAAKTGAKTAASTTRKRPVKAKTAR